MSDGQGNMGLPNKLPASCTGQLVLSLLVSLEKGSFNNQKNLHTSFVFLCDSEPQSPQLFHKLNYHICCVCNRCIAFLL